MFCCRWYVVLFCARVVVCLFVVVVCVCVLLGVREGFLSTIQNNIAQTNLYPQWCNVGTRNKESWHRTYFIELTRTPWGAISMNKTKLIQCLHMSWYIDSLDIYRLLLHCVATLKLTTCRPVSVYTRAYLLKFDCETSNTAYENRARICSWNQPVLRSFV